MNVANNNIYNCTAEGVTAQLGHGWRVFNAEIGISFWCCAALPPTHGEHHDGGRGCGAGVHRVEKRAGGEKVREPGTGWGLGSGWKGKREDMERGGQCRRGCAGDPDKAGV